MTELVGGCLCGAVRYRATAEPVKSSYCHCRMCQRSAGAPVLAWVSVPVSSFAYVASAPKVYRSSTKAQREFCPDCGTQLVFREDGDANLDITTASLDDPTKWPARYHIWRMSRIAWFDTDDTLPRHEAACEATST